MPYIVHSKVEQASDGDSRGAEDPENDGRQTQPSPDTVAIADTNGE